MHVLYIQGPMQSLWNNQTITDTLLVFKEIGWNIHRNSPHCVFTTFPKGLKLSSNRSCVIIWSHQASFWSEDLKSKCLHLAKLSESPPSVRRGNCNCELQVHSYTLSSSFHKFVICLCQEEVSSLTAVIIPTGSSPASLLPGRVPGMWCALIKSVSPMNESQCLTFPPIPFLNSAPLRTGQCGTRNKAQWRDRVSHDSEHALLPTAM